MLLSPGDHIDYLCRWSIVEYLLSLRLRLLVDGRLSRAITSEFFEVASSNQGFYLVPELDTLFGIVIVIMMELTVLPISVPRWCFHWWGVS